MRNFYVFLFVALPFLGNTQAEIRQGKWAKNVEKGNHQGFVMTDKQFIYTIDFKVNKIKNEQLLHAKIFDKSTLDYQKSFEIKPSYSGENSLDLVQLFSIKETLILVMIENPKDKSGYKRILLQSIHPDGRTEKTIVADTLPSTQNVNEDFQIVVDKAEKSFVICTNYPVSLTDNQKLKITSFNSSLNEKWKKTINFPTREKQFIFSDWRYDGDQNVFFIAKHIIDMYTYTGENTSLKQNAYHLWTYNQTNDKLKEIELSLHQRYIHKISLELDSNRWLLSGIYSNDKQYHSDGVFSLILNTNSTVQSHSLHNFTEEEKRLFQPNFPKNKSSKGIDELQVDKIAVMQNGDFVLIGEEFYKEIDEPIDGRMTVNNFSETFHYQDIALFWHNASGQLKDIYRIPKKQISINDQGKYSSFVLGNDGEKIHFYFNDNPKNESFETDSEETLKTFSSHKKALINGISISADGKMTKQILHSSSRSFHIQPKVSAQMPDRHVYFYIQKRNRFCLMQITFP